MPPSTPRRTTHTYLTRDQRIECQALRKAGHTYKTIANLLGLTERQVGYAITSERATPKKRSGRPRVLTDAQIDELEQYVRSTRTTRQLSYLALAKGPFEHWGVGEYVIRNALRSRGYNRCIARAKPPLTEVNRQKRLLWARAHVDWQPEQWARILWSDESWVTGGRHRRKWVTRRPGEELDDTCIIEKIRKKRGWMLWGCFSGSTKGPVLFWEKEWGSINSQSYSERIVPLVDGWIRLHPELLFMQDGATGHSAALTIQELNERGIIPIDWPPFSPDLNPIETVWNKLKDYIEIHYPDLDGGKQYTYDKLRQIVREAWDSISSELLQSLVDTMHDRCQAVIDADGGHTVY
jgi:transposase